MAKAGVGYVLVMAIDFGTAFSGYSMSFADDAGNIITNANWEGGGCQVKMSIKLMWECKCAQ